MIRQSSEARDRLEELARGVVHRSADTGSFLQQVRAPDVSNEDEIACQGADGVFTACQVSDEESQMLRSVTGCMRHRHTYVADVDSGSVTDGVSRLERLGTVTEL